MSKKDKKLVIAGKEFNSRLIIGTGKFKNYNINNKALIASGAEIITVAMKRINMQKKKESMLTDYINPKLYVSMHWGMGFAASLWVYGRWDARIHKWNHQNWLRHTQRC